MSDARITAQSLMLAGRTWEQADALLTTIEAEARAAVVSVIDTHIPSLSDANDIELDELRYNSDRDRFGQPAVENSDLAIRTCSCGQRIDGFYAYIDHLKDELLKAGLITDTGRRLT